MPTDHDEWLKRQDEIREALLKQDELDNIIQFAAVRQILGDDFKGLYLCPAFYPARFMPRSIGEWTYLDIQNLAAKPEVFLEENPHSYFVQHDLHDLDYPLELRRGGFDLVYFNGDFAGRGTTYFAANHCVRVGGLVVVLNRRETLFDLEDDLERYADDPKLRSHCERWIRDWRPQNVRFTEQHPNYEVVFNPPYPSRAILIKTSQDVDAEIRYRRWLDEELERIDYNWNAC